MSKNLLNEGYEKNTELFYKGDKEKIFSKKKSYLDLSMCAGSILLGHNHFIFQNSIKKFLKRKISNFAAPNFYAETFSKKIKKVIPHAHQLIFCNSGSEAVIKSLRIARAINNNPKICYTSGSWHGSVDQFLYKSNKNLKAVRLSSGLPDETLKNLILLPFNNLEKTKEILNKNKKKISSIIIEPIQGSLPNHEIKNYLKFLSHYSKKNNITLIFDEMITGIRTDCSSIQNYFGINAEISTFGKCFGGGLPIGIISISKKISKKLKKIKPKVFFGGTFSGNSMSTYVGNDVLDYIIKNKKKIFSKINDNAEYFEKTLNNFFEEKNIDIKVYRFKSMLRLVFTKAKIKDRLGRDFLEEKKNKSIIQFKKYLRKQKIYMPSSGIIFFSYSHEKRHIAYLISKIKTGSLKYFV